LNDYAQRIQGKQVLIEDGKNYIIDKIPDFSAERNKMRSITTINIGADTLKGTTHVEYNGESKAMLQGVYTLFVMTRRKMRYHLFSGMVMIILFYQMLKSLIFKKTKAVGGEF
jgi:hypothetical protein